MEHGAARAAVPLFGVPVAVKVNIDVAGMVTTAACASFAYTASVDVGVVRQLKQAGRVVMGKCNLDQFATGLQWIGVGGGARAGALGTDTAGSGRVPAGFNGLKPTRGALSTAGVVPACRALDCVSIFALNLDDACLAYDVVAQYEPDNPFSRRLPPPPPAPAATLRIAVDSNPQWHGDAAQEAAYHAALASAGEHGCVGNQAIDGAYITSDMACV
ncbi:Allophanate hydrolase [Lasiodiplodia theobromae]|uniref:Allophanate hydrolase n=1 Tax=Lasiodiplodia theobromae TaxID=45133 RepID=UPI0015C2E5E6|nr:Allophanate hydrolase [Lasiodiplodia theobromae]KAF4535031.1 Allophanate hydrolase [Lasiodiplodia theobromae]